MDNNVVVQSDATWCCHVATFFHRRSFFAHRAVPLADCIFFEFHQLFASCILMPSVLLCARMSTITTVDSQRSPSSTFLLFLQTLSLTLNKRVSMLKSAKFPTLLPKELLTEEEELTELTVESPHISHPTAMLNSTLLRNPHQLP